MRDWIDEVEKRLRTAKLDGAAERDIAEELAQHLQDRYEELCTRGTPEPAARAQVLKELGEDDMFARRVRAVVHARAEPLAIGRPTFGGWLSGLWSDVRFGARMLLRAPVYTAVAVVIIALGIGANTVIFTVVNAALLRPPAGVVAPHELASVFTSDYSGPRIGSSAYADVQAIREAPDIFEAVGAYTIQLFSVAGDGWYTRAMGEVVSANYFDVLGVQPAVGRFFATDEADAGREASVAVISHELWQQRFGGTAHVIGQKITIKSEPLTVIGVAPRGFGGSIRGMRMQLWLPLSAPRSLVGSDPMHRGNRRFQVTGRLRDGVTIEQAQERLNMIASRLHREFPEQWTDVNNQSRVFTIVPEAEARVPQAMRGAIIGFLGMLTLAVLIVLLIACTNVANLMLSRAAARRTELGIRVALGATRGRIVRHLLAESVVLASLGGAAGILLAVWLARLLNAFRLPALPVALDVTVDVRVLAFATAMTLITGILFGLAPALQSSRAPAPLLKDDARSGGRARMRKAFTIVQVASSLVLLVGAGLFLRSLRAAQDIDTGFEADNVVLTRFDLETEGYSAARAAAFYDELVQRASALAGTTALTLAETVPLGLGFSRRSLAVAGYEPAEDEDMEMIFNGVLPGYFSTMGIALRRGRDFTRADRAGAPPVVIVSESFARRFWPNDDAIGKLVGLDGADGPLAEVIGIAPDAKYRSLTAQPEPYYYYPYLQRPDLNMTLLVRTAGDPAVLERALRNEIRALGPRLPQPVIITFREHVSLALLPQRIAAMLLSGLGILAVIIAAIGLYGIVAFGVAQRAREFGIRMALGAVAGDVRRLVMGDALRLAGIGIACGAPIALALAYGIRSFLMVPPLDPVPFVAVPLLLAGCTLLASYAPARRATAQDPANALRAD